MNEKVLFFDIDGTLINFKGQMPESTKEALRLVRQNKHKTVLCTGRCRCQIYGHLLSFGFDGIVGSAGAYVEAQEKVVYKHTMKPEELAGLLEYFDSRDAVYLLQTAGGTISTQKGKRRIGELLRDEMKMPQERIDRLFGLMTVDEELYHRDDIEKLVYYDSPDGFAKVRAAMSSYFELTPFSFDLPVESRGEITCCGENKATGMQHYLDTLGLQPKDAIAFGDGPNDFDMIRYAGTSVVMGNGKEELKKEASFVTDSVEEDGIFNAMKKLQLI